MRIPEVKNNQTKENLDNEIKQLINRLNEINHSKNNNVNNIIHFNSEKPVNDIDQIVNNYKQNELTINEQSTNINITDSTSQITNQTLKTIKSIISDSKNYISTDIHQDIDKYILRINKLLRIKEKSLSYEKLQNWGENEKLQWPDEKISDLIGTMSMSSDFFD